MQQSFDVLHTERLEKKTVLLQLVSQGPHKIN